MVWTGPQGRYRYVSFSSLPIPISSSYTYHRHSFRHLAMPSSAFFLRTGLALVSFTSTVFQASAQTVTPVGTWKPGPTCSAGGDPTVNNGLGGGGYTDKYGGIWDARCANTLPNAVAVGLSATGTTNGQGWYGCSKGCVKRPGCTAFLFTPNYASGTVPRNTWGEKIGSGSCNYYSAAGAYSPGDPTTLYGAAHLVRANTQLPVSCSYLFVVLVFLTCRP